MNEARRSRLEGEIQRALSELTARAVKDPRVGNVTITAVKLAPDLSTARVFFVPFAGQQSPEDVGAGLTRAGGFLRGEVGRRLGMRHAPRLEFVFDEQLERAQRLTDLIDDAVKSDRRAGDVSGDDPAR
jgi:ribosome-binding factor A